MGELPHVVCVLPQSKFVLPAVVCEEHHVGWELSHVVCELSDDGDEVAATGLKLAYAVCVVPAAVRACAASGSEALDDGRRRAPVGVELASRMPCGSSFRHAAPTCAS